jgi:hypothetical protein
MASRLSRCVGALSVLTVVGATLPVAARQETAAPAKFTTGVPQRDTLIRMTRKITVDFTDKRLEDVINFIQTSSGADIEALWADERNSDGLDKEKLVSVKVDNQTFLTLVEKILERAKGDTGGECTWQMSESGAIQLGPKDRLNKIRRVQIYDINDLIVEIPEYTDVPRIDLQQALQASAQGGGGGGQSPFREQGNDDQQQKTRERQERIDEVVQLLQQLVEPEQWVDNGGSGGTLKVFRGALVVNAPDYMHRAIDGYKYWPPGRNQFRHRQRPPLRES